MKEAFTGSVRDLYKVDENTLLFVASDRISAYDMIMQNVSDPVVCSFGEAHQQSRRDVGNTGQRDHSHPYDGPLVQISHSKNP